MKAIVQFGPNDFGMQEVNIDDPMPREIVVRTVSAGVCHSDLFIAHGGGFPTPVVLGHEGAGVVEAVGSQVTAFKPGDHVVAVCTPFCGQCEQCLTGHPNRCKSGLTARAPGERPRLSLAKDGTPLNQFASVGCFAERMLLHENGVVKIDPAFPLTKAALLSCGVLTGTGAVIHTAKVPPGATVAVFGVGGVGLSVVQGARLVGARRIIAVDLLENKLAWAKEFGATDLVNASTQDPVAAIQEITGGGVDYSFAAIGVKKVMEQCFECLAEGGTATIIGVITGTIELTARMFLRERKLQGSLMGSNKFRVDIPRLIEFHQQGRLKLDEMVTRTARLEDLNETFRALEAGEVARQVLLFD